MHRALQFPDINDDIDTLAYLEDLCRLIADTKLNNRNICLVYSDRSLSLTIEKTWVLGLIIYELISNCARHAFNSRGGEIRVEIVSTPDQVECRVSDDGASPLVVHRGRGLRIIDNLAAGLGGRLEQHFGQEGSVSRVIFPA